MHEIVGRYRTVTDARIRELTYDKRICALLCENCHKTKPITAKKYTDWIFGRLIHMYTKNSVEQALNAIPKTYRLGIYLPE